MDDFDLDDAGLVFVVPFTLLLMIATGWLNWYAYKKWAIDDAVFVSIASATLWGFILWLCWRSISD